MTSFAVARGMHWSMTSNPLLSSSKLFNFPLSSLVHKFQQLPRFALAEKKPFDMSFLQQSARTLVRSSRPAVRAFTTTPQPRKIVPDAVKEPLKKADRAVSDAAVAGIEKGRT